MGNSMKAYPYQPLQGVEIYIDTATFDDFEKDVSVTIEAQLGVIGGTLGLFAGFSILSGVELLPQDDGADHIKEQEIHVNNISLGKYMKKSRIQETLNLSTDADNRTYTFFYL